MCEIKFCNKQNQTYLDCDYVADLPQVIDVHLLETSVFFDQIEQVLQE